MVMKDDRSGPDSLMTLWNKEPQHLFFIKKLDRFNADKSLETILLILYRVSPLLLFAAYGV
jgi:hypothetical protein